VSEIVSFNYFTYFILFDTTNGYHTGVEPSYYSGLSGFIFIIFLGHPRLEHLQRGVLRVPGERFLGHTHAQGAEPQVLPSSLCPHLQASRCFTLR
jgi:hypothetical protein